MDCPGWEVSSLVQYVSSILTFRTVLNALDRSTILFRDCLVWGKVLIVLNIRMRESAGY